MSAPPAPPRPPLAWHPRTDGDQPDHARFQRPECADYEVRTQHGLWTSPMTGARQSIWSIYHDENHIDAQLVRQGWAVQWPDPARTATITTHDDLIALVHAYPCTRHRSLNVLITLTGAPFDEWPLHDDMLSPPLDFQAMAADFDAVHLTEAGRRATCETLPGTAHWSVETVLWLNPVWRVLHPITTVPAPRA